MVVDMGSATETHPQNLNALFNPTSVAVIGASPRKGAIGREIVYNMMKGGFTGKIYPVHPKASHIHELKAYRSVTEISGPVDLAVVIVPQRYVLTVINECGNKSVKAVIVITAGYKESGKEGAKLEEELLAAIRRHGMRMLGPNCFGLINMNPDVRLNATFSPVQPVPGNVALLSQSGAFGVSIMEYMGRMNIGFSSFVSTGNSADITSDALIAHWARDPSTSIIAAYMESFGDPRMFLQAARGTTKHKPIIVVKSGRTPAGQRAASSHTGALAGTDTVIDAFLHQCGVIRSNSISEMQSLVAAFSRCHLPKGNRVAILTNSGGPGIMATDSLIAGGMEMARFEEETLAQLRGMMPTEAAIAANPVDFTASGVPGTYRDVLSLLLDDPNVDIVIPIFVPPLMVTPADVARAITEALRSHNTKEGPGGHVKPVFGVIMAEESSYQMVYGELPDCPPIYPFTEMAAGACIEMHRYAEWQRRPEGTIHRFTARTDEARAILRSHRKAGRVQIPAADGMRILACYGLPTTATQEVETVGEALESAREIGYPVSLKAAGRKLAHKSDTGAVMLGIRNDAELRDACVQVQGAIERAGHGPGDEAWVVQGMVKPGREVILGASVDPIMGPSITFGTGGKYVEILRDVVTRIPPITDLDAEEMVRSVRGHALLSGVRGEEAVALGFLGKCLMRFSQMVLELDEITQVDLNPFILHPNPSECAIVDARIWVGSS